MTAFLAIVAVGIGTYFTRAVFIVSLARRRIPDSLVRALEFVGPSVLSALLVTLVVAPDGTLALGVPEWAGLVGGGFTAYKSRNMLLTVTIGMTLYWVIRALL